MRKLAIAVLGTALALGAKWTDDDRISHALNRLTFGARPGDAEAVRSKGLKKWIDEQLHPERIAENPALAAKLEPLKTLTMSTAEIAREFPLRANAKRPGLSPEQMKQMRDASPEERREMLKDIRPQAIVARDLFEGKIYRAVYSNRQLEEVLTDFWFNHFNVHAGKGPVRLMVTSYERDAIRPHVLGKFKDLVRATAQHPAMLFYLDNAQSMSPDSPAARRRGKRRGLNENYARELMELHTLGVDGGYTQKDVTEVARAFTGWTIRTPRMGGGFEFNSRFHDSGEKTVLGRKIAAGGGQSDGLEVIGILGAHPSTAKFISRKLAQRFVADEPPPQLVAAMAKTFTQTDGDIRAVIKTMVDSKAFWDERQYRSKVKSPLELVVSAVRAAGAEVDSAMALAQKVEALGQPLYRKVEPTGYPNTGEEWINSASLVARMNFATALAGNQIPGVRVSGDSRPSGLQLGSPEFQRR